MPSSSKEIFKNQMYFKNFERSFFMEENYADGTYREWPVFYENGIKSRWSAFQHFGMDILYNHWGYEIDSPTFLMPYFDEEIIRETETTLIRRSYWGTLEEKFKDGRDGGRLFDPIIVTPEDWARIKAERFNVDDPKRNMDIAKIKEDTRYTSDMPFGLFVGALLGLSLYTLTLEGMIYACHDYPEMIEDIVETNCLLMERYIDQMLPHFEVDIAFIWEYLTCKNGPIVPVWVVRDIIAPRLKRICDKLKNYGVGIISVYSDGYIQPILPIFMDCGINCLSHRAVSCGSDHPGKLLDEYPGELRILGAVDKLIFHKGKDAIDNYMKSIIPYVKRGGFIPHVDHMVYPQMKQENYLHYIQRFHQLFG